MFVVVIPHGGLFRLGRGTSRDDLHTASQCRCGKCLESVAIEEHIRMLWRFLCEVNSPTDFRDEQKHRTPYQRP